MPTYFIVSRNRRGGTTSPVGYHTPNPAEETPGTFLSFAQTFPGAANSIYKRNDIPAQGDRAPCGNCFPHVHLLTGTGRVSSSPRRANEHETPRLRLSRTPRNVSHRGTRRRSVPMPHSHPEGPVQVTLVSRSKLLSSPPCLRTHSG